MGTRTAKGRDRAREVADAMEQIKKTPALLEAFESIHQILANDGFDRKYRIGQLVQEALAMDGLDALRLVADDTGKSVAELKRMGRVPEVFPPARAAELRARKTITRLPISYDHLMVLADPKVAAIREELIERVFDEDLSAKALQAAVRAITGGRISRSGQRLDS